MVEWLTLVIPAAHTETDVKNGPLPKLRGEVILLIWVGYESIVRCHHGNVEMDEVLEERRLIRARISGGH